jgi:hypothetical protein
MSIRKFYSKRLVIFEKASDFLLKSQFLLICHQKASQYLSKASNSLKLSLKSLKIVQNASHYWKKPRFLFKCFKKASISLKMSSKRIKIFKMQRILKKSLAFSKKSLTFLKKKSLAALTSPPLRLIINIFLEFK